MKMQVTNMQVKGTDFVADTAVVVDHEGNLAAQSLVAVVLEGSLAAQILVAVH